MRSANTKVLGPASLALFLFGLPAAVIAAPHYVASLLHPPHLLTSTARGNTNGMQVGGGGNSVSHALLWTDSEGLVDLHPTLYQSSIALATDGLSQVGVGTFPGQSYSRALLWKGTPESVIDLQPLHYQMSFAFAVAGNTQVGYGFFYDNQSLPAIHATLWHGTAESAVDLNPEGYSFSLGSGASEISQVGGGNLEEGGGGRALLWHGNAGSAVSLHPAGYYSSFASDATETSQVGSGETLARETHALLWYGSAESVVDLHPAGYGFSTAYSVSAFGQAGLGKRPGETATRALVWTGNAASVVDLHESLAALGPAFTDSIANSIADNGEVVGSATSFTDGVYETFAVKWSLVPEPESLQLLFGGMLGIAVTVVRMGRCAQCREISRAPRNSRETMQVEGE